MRNRKAFLFDMDGTMVDNMQYHLQAWQKIVAEAGSVMEGEEMFKELYGKNTEILTRILGTNKFTISEIKEMADRKDAYYREIYGPHAVLIPGLREFLTEAKNQQISLAIASATLNKNVQFVIDKLSLQTFFDVIISGSDVSISKPDPETFLKAAKGLGILPSNCVVFEDVPKGIEAAMRADMKAVVLLTSHKKQDFDGFSNVIKLITDYRSVNVTNFL
ncbi:MAG: beta-phosphoglucomutase family hydrolase [Chitinophagaceae bacterium]